MDRDRWQKIDQLFAAAMDLAPEDRPAFLERAAAGEEDLRREVESLLAHHGLGAPLLQSAARDLEQLAARLVPDAVSGERIGPYRVIREIGRGGMGTVYLAERADEQFQMQVAVKLARLGLSADALIERFRLERQILAGLDHPNIARLFDGGATEDGRPYIVMEFVEGLPLLDYCQGRQLPLRRRLELFRTVCSAVHYAHQHLVVHRDLKPGNILVTETGAPKLLDFGIAKLLGPGLDAGRGSSAPTAISLMTPEYASPEQVRGEAITTATDVYSLGVLLYELVTGERPYRSAGPLTHDVMRAVLEEEPARHALLKGELESIVLHAMRKDPRTRYASAEQLSDDVRRHLEGLPLVARRDTAVYRAWKFAKRHKAGVASAILILVLILAFTGATLVQASRLARERDGATRARDQAQRIAGFLQDQLKASDPLESPLQSFTKRDLLDQNAARIQKELAGDPETQATLLVTTAKAYINLGVHESALALLDRALQIRRKLDGPEHPDVAEVLYEMARAEDVRGDYAASERLNRQALEMRRRTMPGDHAEIVDSLNNVANMVQSLRNPTEAEPLYREALAMAQRLPDRDRKHLAVATNNLALCLYLKGDFRAAQQLWLENLENQRQANGPIHPNTAFAVDNIASSYLALGLYAEAENYYREALAMRRQLFGDEHPDVARTLNNWGTVRLRRGDYAGAEALHREALAIRRKLLSADHPDLAVTLDNLGAAVAAQGRFAEGERLVRQALTIRRARFHDENPMIARSLHNLGVVQYRKGAFAEAEGSLRDALAQRRKLLGSQHTDTAYTMAWLAIVLAAKGDTAAVPAIAQEALALQRKKLGADHPEVAYALTALGMAAEREGNFAGAESSYREALAIRRARLGTGSSLVAESEASVARVVAARAPGRL